ncbi:hypothetical protein ACSSTO_09775 [Bacillus atrophaeus]|uniref:hypothetical protein n=1 Tax=Bacillus atrophaeus TaxID=1452 RepID=UPI003EDADC03
MGDTISHISKKIYKKLILELNEKDFFEKAVTLELIKVNPNEDLKIPKKQKSTKMEKADEDIIFLEKEEFAYFLKLPQSDGLEINDFTVLSYIGLRVGKLLALKWANFNEKQSTIRVTKHFIILTGWTSTIKND